MTFLNPGESVNLTDFYSTIKKSFINMRCDREELLDVITEQRTEGKDKHAKQKALAVKKDIKQMLAEEDEGGQEEDGEEKE